MNWKTLHSEYLFKDLWFTVRKDTCERPDGKLVTPYYVYEFPTWVTAIALTREGRIIFEKQYRHALGLTMFEIPGGCVDPSDPSLEAAVARELKEETGYVFDNYEYLGKTSANPSTHNNWMHFYLATGGVRLADPELDDNEDIEVHLFSVDEVKRMLRNNEIVQSMHVTALFYALERMGALRY
jgi:8-oxo-dGTP pyrophosphatase MutT (NUDIX family)